MPVFNINETVLKTPDGKLLDLFHTTPYPGGIKKYFPLSHFGTAKAANMRAVFYIEECAQVDVENEEPSEYISPRIIKMLGSHVPPMSGQKLNLYMKNPLEIPDLRDHSIMGYFYFFKGLYKPQSRFLSQEEWMDMAAKGCSRAEYKELLTEYIFIEPYLSPRHSLITELRCDSLFDPMPHATCELDILPAWVRRAYPVQSKAVAPVELANRVVFQRMIHFLEGEGYDGFKYKNVYEDTGSTSYIIFRPEQVFNALNRKSHLHRVAPISKTCKEFLLKQEHEFFSKNGTLSPSERLVEYEKAGYLKNRVLEFDRR